MKPTRTPLLRAATASAMALIAAQALHAAGGSWVLTTTPASWGTAANWTPAAVPGIAIGDAVTINTNLTAAATITLDGARTVGDLNIGDSTTGFFGFTLSAGTSGSLVMDVASGSATIDFLNSGTNGAANTISAPITLNDNLVVRSNNTLVHTLSGVISGSGMSVTFNNDTNGTANAATATQGQFALSGVNTYSGGTSISDVRVAVSTSDSALGTGNVTIASGGQVYCSTARTLANTFSIAGNGWAETATGQPFGALRLEGNAIVSGAVTMTANAGIGSNTGTATVSGIVSETSGAFNLTKRGPGTIVLSGVNTYSGGTTIPNGILQLNNNSAAGSGAIALAAGGGTAGTRLAINAGVTIANNVTIPATTGASGRGNIEYAGTTGVATLNGTLTITGAPSAGGHFYGGPSAANVLHLAGPITSSVGLSQRDLFVKYSGGGTGYTAFTVTGTAIVGVNNGLSTAAVVTLGGSGNTNLDLNGLNQSLAGIARNANTCTIGNSSTTADSTLTITGSSLYSGNITNIISTGNRKVGLTVSGGALTLSGTNTHTGPTNVTGGSLIVTSTAALPPASNLTVSTGAKFGFQPTVAGGLTMGSATYSFATGSTIGGAIGGTNSQSVAAFPGASGTTGNITVDVWAVPGAAVSPGTHNLFTAASGFNAATLTLGNIYNATDFTVSNLVKTDTLVSVDVTAATPITTAYWKGGLAGSTTVWSATNGSTQSNWVTSLGGSDQPLTPGAGADVIFSNSTVTTAPTGTTLGSSMSIKSLTISDTVSGMSLNNTVNNHSLTIGAGGLTMSALVPASTISAPVIVTADQTWTNNSTNALTVNSSLAGTTFGLTKAGTGPIAITNATYSGATNVNAGSLTLTGGTLNGSTVTVAPGASLTASSVISGAGSLTTSGTTSISGANTYTGSTSVNAGSLTMTGGTVSGSSLTVASGATLNQTGGVLSGAWTLDTAGTTTLAGTNTFTGDINLTGGVLSVNMGNGITGNLGSVTTPASFSKMVNISNNATFRSTAAAFNDNPGSATVLQLVFNIGTGGAILETPSATTMTIDDGAVAGNANNAAQLQGAGNLTKIGAGTLSLGNGTSNYATFTGQIFVNEGTLTTGAVSTNPFGDTAAGTTIASGAVLDVKGVSIGAEPVTINGTGLASAPAGALISSTGTGGIATGPVTVASASDFGGAGTLTLSGSVSGTGGLNKVGAGAALLTGDVSGFTGPLTLTAGTLTIDNPIPASALTVSAGTLTVNDASSISGPLTVNGGTLYGEITSTSMILGGGTLFFDPNTVDKLTTGALTVNGPVTLDVTSLAPANTTVPVISATSLTGTGTFSVANAANYRTAPAVSATNSGVTVTFAAGKTLNWTGTASGVWNVNSAINWNDGSGADVFFAGDSVTLPEGGANPAITLTGLLSPAGLAVTSDTTNYTLTATTGNQLTGATGITKTGASTLTLTGANLHSGVTSIGGGVVSIIGINGIGNAAPGNSIAFSNGGKLRYTGTTSIVLGVNRNIAVGTGGGTLAFNSGTAATTTVSGDISGNGALGFLSEGAATGTYSLTGDNSAYAGAMSITSAAAGVTTVSLANQTAVPTSGSITVNHPAGAAVNANNTLTLAGVNIPAGVTIFTTAGLNSVPVLTRSQITSSGTATINGPIKVTSATSASITQLSPGAGSTLTINGNITEASPGSFVAGSVLFLRGTGNIVVNGTINLPTGNFNRTDAGTITFNSTGNVWANSTINVGTAVLGVTDALCTAAPLTLGQNDTNAVTFNLAGFNQTVAGLISNPVTVGANTTGKAITSATAATLTSSPVADVTYAGLITGAVSLVKSGTFTQTLLGANTYTGGTTVSAGKLVLGSATALGSGAATVNGGSLDLGAQTIANAVTVNAGGTLTGAGTLSTAATLAGTVTPGGAGNGLITLASATVASTDNLAFQLGALGTNVRGTDYDALTVNSALALNGTITVTLNGLTPAIGQSFDLIDSTGAIDVTNFDVATKLILPALGTGLQWNTSSFASTGVISIVVSDPFATWQAAKFTTEELGDVLISGPDADPDKDGISNKLEYAFGLEPKTGNLDPKNRGEASNNAGALTLTYRRPTAIPAGLTPASYVVQVKTTDLVTGNPANSWNDAILNTDYTESVSSSGGVDTITISFTGTVSGKKFARVSVTY